jgi:hypothetical protein
MSEQRSHSLTPVRRPGDAAALIAPRLTPHVAAGSEPTTRFGPVSAGNLPLPKTRERTVSKSIRIPVSMLDQIEALCDTNRLDLSSVVLYYIEQGLRGTFASGKNEAV